MRLLQIGTDFCLAAFQPLFMLFRGYANIYDLMLDMSIVGNVSMDVVNQR
ncbi:hypothetical protein C8R11_10511 [Nitrosomonas aestuarii]|nr:hypothetical protein C8R11_10511 [Nitrosomonas aestuarii]